MGGECIDLMNECIFVGALVANVQSGARSFFFSRLKLANCENLSSAEGEQGGCFRFLPPRAHLRGIRVSVCCSPVHLCKRLDDIFRELLL